MKFGGKCEVKGISLEFKNVGKLKDLSKEDLKKMFEDFMNSRLDRQSNVDDTAEAGCVVRETSDVMTREVYFEDITF